MARSDRLIALRLAEELLAKPYGALARKAVEGYVHDRGPKAPPRLRYEAGVICGVAGVGFRTECVYAESWEALPEVIRNHVRYERLRVVKDWTLAMMACLADGTLDAENGRQFAEWIMAAGNDE